MEAVIFTGSALALRMFFNTFEGFTFRYWGDFEFMVLLIVMNALFLKLSLFELLSFIAIAFVLRQVVRLLSQSSIESIPEEKRPKDVVIVFKRCQNCSNLYDWTQIVSFVVFTFCVVYYKSKIIRFLQA